MDKVDVSMEVERQAVRLCPYELGAIFVTEDTILCPEHLGCLRDRKVRYDDSVGCLAPLALQVVKVEPLLHGGHAFGVRPRVRVALLLREMLAVAGVRGIRDGVREFLELLHARLCQRDTEVERTPSRSIAGPLKESRRAMGLKMAKGSSGLRGSRHREGPEASEQQGCKHPGSSMPGED